MAGSYHQTYIHYIFSTKNRHHLILPENEKRLWSYICGIGINNGYSVISVGGVSDHLHILLSIPATKSVSKVIQEIKGNSSKWMNDNFFPVHRNFRWQGGYGAFSVGRKGIKSLTKYIHNQKEHHRKMTFKEEFRWFLNKYDIEYDEEHLWI